MYCVPQSKYVDPAVEAAEQLPPLAAAALDYRQLSQRVMEGAFRDYHGTVDPECACSGSESIALSCLAPGLAQKAETR